MKKILFTTVSALALAAFADGVNSTEFGALKVPSTAKQTIVAVPWFQSSTGDTAVTVSNLVLTAGFAEGDSIVLFKDGEYSKAWVLNENKAWVGGNVVIGGKTIPAGTDQDTLARGSTLLVKRANPTGGFHLIGKPATSGVGTQSLPSGDPKKPVYALVAPPTTSAADVNAATWVGLTPFQDQLYIDRNGTVEILMWTGDAKKWGSKTSPAGSVITIPEGQGAWFISAGEGTKTVTW